MAEQKYGVKVTVEYYYEVEVDNESEAEEQGWHYEDHAYSGEVYSIQTDHLADRCEGCENWDDECSCEEEESEEEESLLKTGEN
jgi:hypothetical protein